MSVITVGQIAGAQPIPQRTTGSEAPKEGEVLVRAVTQEAEGSLYKLRGQAVVETTEMIIHADEIDYDQEKEYAEARGNVRFDHFAGGEHLEADKVEYDLKTETARYYNVRGSSPAKIEARPGILTTTSPFSFQAQWAERLKNRYILHNGFITNCMLPRPWWVLRGREFDVIPGDRAIARSSVFRLRGIPLFYTPMFYKALNRAPRKSGFLTPNIGNSSRRGLMLGAGYFWAINRSYDTTYRAQLFTQRGIAHHVDFRGKPGEQTDFNFILYGVKDKGPQASDGTRGAPSSGVLTSFTGRSKLAKGFSAEADINYLTSFAFRQDFTESFYEAIQSQVQSIGYLTKHWSTFGFNVLGSRVENFQSRSDNDKISLRRLPSVELRSRDRQVNEKVLPVWVSFDASASLLRRRQRDLEPLDLNLAATDERRSASFERLDFDPRITTALRWKDIHLIPSLSLRQTFYGSSFDQAGRLTGNSLLRNSSDFSLDLILPSISRVFEQPPKFFGARLKHVIESRATFRQVDNVDEFRRIIRFDEADLLSNTTELEVSLTNRLYSKRKDGYVDEILTWTVAQQRYFDPAFGGAIGSNNRNVVLSTARLTDFSFLDRPRHYSPVVSTLRGSPFPGTAVEWRADFDPMRGHFVNSNISIMRNFANNMYASVGHNQIRSSQFLIPPGNQLDWMFRLGQENRRGWSTGLMGRYDYRQSVLQWMQTQITYNTDCCGWSVQYRRFGLQTRSENQFRVAFAIANIGTFGTLKRQDRMF